MILIKLTTQGNYGLKINTPLFQRASVFLSSPLYKWTHVLVMETSHVLLRALLVLLHIGASPNNVHKCSICADPSKYKSTGHIYLAHVFPDIFKREEWREKKC